MKKSQIISLKVILLFIVAIFSTFIGDYLHSFFGDNFCNIPHHLYGGDYHDNPTWHWGYRHWLYSAMCIVLFLIQAIDIINYIIEC